VKCVRWYLSFKPTSRGKLHKDTYEKAKERFKLKTALLQSARDKAVEIYKSFKNVKGKHSEIHLRKCSMRFHKRSPADSEFAGMGGTWIPRTPE
jgi:hypothetical protein